jgi:hypothetical protein
MLILKAKFISVRRYERVDPATGINRVDKSYLVHEAHADGTITAETIYFPRDVDGRRYQEPDLVPNEDYAFPVTARPTKDGKKLTYTARPDMLPK